jgi:hypothetical protein
VAQSQVIPVTGEYLTDIFNPEKYFPISQVRKAWKCKEK